MPGLREPGHAQGDAEQIRRNPRAPELVPPWALVFPRDLGDGRWSAGLRQNYYQGQPEAGHRDRLAPDWHVYAKGLKVFAVIDHSAEASQVGLRLRETTLVVFGDPPAGPPVMGGRALGRALLALKVPIRDDAGRPRSVTTAPPRSPLVTA